MCPINPLSTFRGYINHHFFLHFFLKLLFLLLLFLFFSFRSISHSCNCCLEKYSRAHNLLEIKGWETDSEVFISLDTSRRGETRSKLVISPILWLYVDVLLIDHTSRNHSIINTQPQTTGLDCLSQQANIAIYA